MYLPAHFEESDVTVLHSLIRSHPLGAWVTPIDGALVVNTSRSWSMRRAAPSARWSVTWRDQYRLEVLLAG